MPRTTKVLPTFELGFGWPSVTKFLRAASALVVNAQLRSNLVPVVSSPRNFERNVTIALTANGPVGLTVTSSAPNTGEGAQAKLRLNGLVPQPR